MLKSKLMEMRKESKNDRNKEKICMSSFTLKLIALVLMTISHVGKYLPNMPIYFEWLGRLAAPVFIYMCVWSVHYTHSRKRYILRLYLWSVLTAIVEFILSIRFSITMEGTPIENNIFRTLFLLSVLLSIGYGENKKRKIIYYLLFSAWQVVGMIICLSISYYFNELEDFAFVLFPTILGNILNIEGGLFFILFGIGMNKFKNNKMHLSLFYIAYTLLWVFNYAFNISGMLVQKIPLFIFDGTLSLTLFIMEFCVGFTIFTGRLSWNNLFTTHYQWMMIYALPLLLCYNQKRGKRCKYLFYLYYPIHLIILFLLSI